MYLFQIWLHNSEDQVFLQVDVEGATIDEVLIAAFEKGVTRRFRQHYQKKKRVTCHRIDTVPAASPPPTVKKYPLSPQRCFEYNITKREMEVMLLIKEGNSQKEVADQIGISEGTVKTHVQNVREKTGANSTIEALDNLSA